ncbi:hypothetical protein [Streptomyces sp. NPDC088915]|uniref:hypothetical protein n=1 Tax=Streptomyces sp. NPDC088915 TaxID=3365912 RepID=UPI003829BB9B
MFHITEAMAAELNAAAVFLPQNPAEEDSLPMVGNGGAQVYAYWTTAGLHVSLEFGSTPEALRDANGNVPVRIELGANTVFTTI